MLRKCHKQNIDTEAHRHRHTHTEHTKHSLIIHSFTHLTHKNTQIHLNSNQIFISINIASRFCFPPFYRLHLLLFLPLSFFSPYLLLIVTAGGGGTAAAAAAAADVVGAALVLLVYCFFFPEWYKYIYSLLFSFSFCNHLTSHLTRKKKKKKKKRKKMSEEGTKQKLIFVHCLLPNLPYLK